MTDNQTNWRPPHDLAAQADRIARELLAAERAGNEDELHRLRCLWAILWRSYPVSTGLALMRLHDQQTGRPEREVRSG